MKQIEQQPNLFMSYLLKHLKKKYFEDYHIGTIYSDNINIIYFPFTPTELKEKKLKIAVVYNLKSDRIEVWLAGQNKQIQKEYWEIFRGSNWNKYTIPDSIKNSFSIVYTVLNDRVDFSASESIIKEIESKLLVFIDDMVELLK